MLREEEDARAIARYIMENPLRAGLIERVEDYPLLGSDVWTLEDLLGSL